MSKPLRRLCPATMHERYGDYLNGIRACRGPLTTAHCRLQAI